MSAPKFYTDAEGDKPEPDGVRDVHVSTKGLSQYQYMLMLSLVDMNQGLQYLAEAINEGRFKDIHWEMFQKKFAFTVDQMKMIRELYPDTMA